MTRRRIVRSRSTAAGFTLLEIMLALAILAFVAVLIAGSFTQVSRIKRGIEASQERTHAARVALMRMTREIEMAYLSGSENAFVPEKRTMFIGASHADVDQLRFSWFGRQRMRADTPESDTSVVSYYAEPDPQDRSVLNLIRRETRRLEAKDPQTIPGEAYVLCPGISKLKFTYYDFPRKEWREEWNTMGVDGRAYPPSHVKIALTIFDERGREVLYSSAARIQMTERVDYRPSRTN